MNNFHSTSIFSSTVFVGVILSMSVPDHLRIDIHQLEMHEMLFQQCMWPSRPGEWHFLLEGVNKYLLHPLNTRQLKVPHVVFSSESADEALSQVQQKTGKNQWMLSGKPREIEPAPTKQRVALNPVLLPKLGYIQITVTEVKLYIIDITLSILIVNCCLPCLFR